jgi:hypothetical protein
VRTTGDAAAYRPWGDDEDRLWDAAAYRLWGDDAKPPERRDAEPAERHAADLPSDTTDLPSDTTPNRPSDAAP